MEAISRKPVQKKKKKKKNTGIPSKHPQKILADEKHSDQSVILPPS
jgi:hypothetical protein